MFSIHDLLQSVDLHHAQGHSQIFNLVWARRDHSFNFPCFLYYLKFFLNFLQFPNFGLPGGWLAHPGRPWLHLWPCLTERVLLPFYNCIGLWQEVTNWCKWYELSDFRKKSTLGRSCLMENSYILCKVHLLWWLLHFILACTWYTTGTSQYLFNFSHVFWC